MLYFFYFRKDYIHYANYVEFFIILSNDSSIDVLCVFYFYRQQQMDKNNISGFENCLFINLSNNATLSRCFYKLYEWYYHFLRCNMVKASIRKLLTPIIESPNKVSDEQQLIMNLNNITSFYKRHIHSAGFETSYQTAMINLIGLISFQKKFEQTNFLHASQVLDGVLSLEVCISQKAFSNIFSTEDSSVFFIVKSTVELVTEVKTVGEKTFRHILSIYNCLCYHIKKYYYRHPVKYRKFIEYMGVILCYLLVELKQNADTQ